MKSGKLLAAAVVLILILGQQMTHGRDKEKEKSVGYKVGVFMRELNDGVQKKIDDNPKTKSSMTKGIDVLSDNIIDAVDPNADDFARDMAKKSVQLFLNPSQSEKDRIFDEMTAPIKKNMEGINAMCSSSSSTPNSSSPSNDTHSEQSESRESGSTRSSYKEPDEVSQTNNRGNQSYQSNGWSQKSNASNSSSTDFRKTSDSAIIDYCQYQIIVSRISTLSGEIAENINKLLTVTHRDLSRFFKQKGVGENSKLLAFVTMIISGLFGLYISKKVFFGFMKIWLVTAEKR